MKLIEFLVNKENTLLQDFKDPGLKAAREREREGGNSGSGLLFVSFFLVRGEGMGYVSIPGGVLRGRRQFKLRSSCPRKHMVRCEVHREHREKYGIPTPVEGEPLRLDDLRENLVRQEETIIFAIVERAQFAMNDAVYDSEKLPVPGFDGCFSQYLLYELEKVRLHLRCWHRSRA